MANFSRWLTANDVINRSAVEVGLNPVNDAFAAGDPNFQSLRFLLNSCGQELIQEYNWNLANRAVEFTTTAQSVYDLPDDFSHMIDQTGWQKGTPTGAVPLLGPASEQWWSYLVATNLYNVTIYAWFRIKEGKLHLFPNPPPVGIPIRYEYCSRAWVKAGDAPDTYRDSAQIPSDLILYEPVMIIKMLKSRFLQAKGFDNTKAEDEYQLALEAWKGKDKAAPKLNVSQSQFHNRFLSTYGNTPETGYGPP